MSGAQTSGGDGTERMPYPGLRSFLREETDLFFGREGTVNEMLRRLARTRFLAVLGASGSGKSSLVRTGMLDGLELGLIAEAGSWWRVIDVRPGGAPMRALARALAGEDAGEDEVEQLRAFLLRGPRALIEWAGDGRLAKGENLLVLVDQFEELFRYQSYKDHQEAEAFIALLLESARSRDLPIHLTLTMRSEYLGACALFTGLAEAMNDGQFLTPRMTRDQCRRAIEGPARVCGFAIEPGLVSRMLNDLGNFAPWEDRGDADLRSQLDLIGRRADQLPLLQHALNRLWLQAAARGDAPVLRLDDYLAFGGLRGTIDHHAREMVAALTPAQRAVVPLLFRALTAGSGLADAVRRPTLLGDLVRIAGAPDADVRAVVEAFRARGCNFLMPPPQVPLTDATIIDISHESLIRQWEDLARWLADEAGDAAQIRRLDEAAERNATGRGELLSGRDLAPLAEWRRGARLTDAWAGRYVADPARAFRFLDDSSDAARRARQRKRVVPGLLVALALVAAISAGFGLLQQSQNRQLADEKAETEKLNDQLSAVNSELESKAAEIRRANEELVSKTSGFVADLIAGRQANGALTDAADILAGFVPSAAAAADLPESFPDLFALQHVIDVSVRLPPLQAGAVRPAGTGRVPEAVPEVEVERLEFVPYLETLTQKAAQKPLRLVSAVGNDDQLLLVDLRSGRTQATIFHDSFAHGAIGQTFVALDGTQAVLVLGNGRLMRWTLGDDRTRRVMDTRWLSQPASTGNGSGNRVVDDVVFDRNSGSIAVTYRQFDTRFLTVLGPAGAAKADSWTYSRIALALGKAVSVVEPNNGPWEGDLIPVTMQGGRLILFDTATTALFAFDPAAGTGALILPRGLVSAVYPTADPDAVALLVEVGVTGCIGSVDPLALALAMPNPDVANCLVTFDLATGTVRGAGQPVPATWLAGTDASDHDWRSALLAGAVASLDADTSLPGVFGGFDPEAGAPRFRIARGDGAGIPPDGPAVLESWHYLEGLGAGIGWQSKFFESGAPRLALYDLEAGFEVSFVKSIEGFQAFPDDSATEGTGTGTMTGIPSILLHRASAPEARAQGQVMDPLRIDLTGPADVTGMVVVPTGKAALISTQAGLFLQQHLLEGQPAITPITGTIPVCRPGAQTEGGKTVGGRTADGRIVGAGGQEADVAGPAGASQRGGLSGLLPQAALGPEGEHFLLYSPGQDQTYVLTLPRGQAGETLMGRLGCLSTGFGAAWVVDPMNGQVVLTGAAEDELLLWQPAEWPGLDTVPARLSLADEDGARATALLDDGRLVVLTGKGNLALFAAQPAMAMGPMRVIKPDLVFPAFLPGAEGIAARDGAIALYRREARLGAGALTVMMARIDDATGRPVVQSGGMLPIIGSEILGLRVADMAGQVEVLSAGGALVRFALVPMPGADILPAALSASGNAARLRQSGTLGTDAGIAALLAETKTREAREPVAPNDAILCGAGVEKIYARWRKDTDQAEPLDGGLAMACNRLGADAAVAGIVGDLAEGLRRGDAAAEGTDPWPAGWSRLLAAAGDGDPAALRGVLTAIATSAPQTDVGTPGAFAASDLLAGIFGPPGPGGPDAVLLPGAGAVLAPGRDMADAGVQRGLGLVAEAAGDAAAAYMHFARAEQVLREAELEAEADRIALRRIAAALELGPEARAAAAADLAGWEPGFGQAALMDIPDAAADLAALDRLGAAVGRPDLTAMIRIERLAFGLLSDDGETRRQAALAIAEIAAVMPSWPAFAASRGGLDKVLGRALSILGEAEADRVTEGLRLRLALAMISLIENDGAPVDFSWTGGTAEYRLAIGVAVAAAPEDLAAAAPALRFNSGAFGFSVRVSDAEAARAAQQVLADRLTLCAALPEAEGALAACATTPYWQAIQAFEVSMDDSLASPEERKKAAEAYAPLLAQAFAGLQESYASGGGIADDVFGAYASATVWVASSQATLRNRNVEPATEAYLTGFQVIDDLLRRAETGQPIWPRDKPVADALEYLNGVIFDLTQPSLPEPPFVERDLPALRRALDALVSAHEWESIYGMGGLDQADTDELDYIGLIWFKPYAIAYAAGRQRNRMGDLVPLSPLGQDCARRASSYLDPMRTAPAVDFLTLSQDAEAVAICQAAYDEAWHSNGGKAEPALSYLLARALSAEAAREEVATDQFSPLIGYFVEAALAGYAAAFNNLDAQLGLSSPQNSTGPGFGYQQRVVQTAFADAYYAFQALDLTDRDRAALLFFAQQAGDLGSVEANRIAAALAPDPVEKYLRLTIAAQLYNRRQEDAAGYSALLAEAAAIPLDYAESSLALARLAAWTLVEPVRLPEDLVLLPSPGPSLPE